MALCCSKGQPLGGHIVVLNAPSSTSLREQLSQFSAALKSNITSATFLNTRSGYYPNSQVPISSLHDNEFRRLMQWCGLAQDRAAHGGVVVLDVPDVKGSNLAALKHIWTNTSIGELPSTCVFLHAPLKGALAGTTFEDSVHHMVEYGMRHVGTNIKANSLEVLKGSDLAAIVTRALDKPSALNLCLSDKKVICDKVSMFLKEALNVASLGKVYVQPRTSHDFVHSLAASPMSGAAQLVRLLRSKPAVHAVSFNRPLSTEQETSLRLRDTDEPLGSVALRNAPRIVDGVEAFEPLSGTCLGRLLQHLENQTAAAPAGTSDLYSILGGSVYEEAVKKPSEKKDPEYQLYTGGSCIANYGRALLIGYDYHVSMGKGATKPDPAYKMTKGEPLHGCGTDANRMRDALEGTGWTKGNIRVVTDTTDHGFVGKTGKQDKEGMKKAIAWLVEGAKPGDALFLFFAGHGTKKRDAKAPGQHRETDCQDEGIAPLYYNEDKTDTLYFDDELYQDLVYPLPLGVRLTCVFDSCNAGTVLDLPFIYDSQKKLIVPDYSETPTENCDPKKGPVLANTKKSWRNFFLKGLKDASDQYNGAGKYYFGDVVDLSKADPQLKGMADVIAWSAASDRQHAYMISTSDKSYQGGIFAKAFTETYVDLYRRSFGHGATYSEFADALRAAVKRIDQDKQDPQLQTTTPFDATKRRFVVNDILANRNKQITEHRNTLLGITGEAVPACKPVTEYKGEVISKKPKPPAPVIVTIPEPPVPMPPLPPGGSFGWCIPMEMLGCQQPVVPYPVPVPETCPCPPNATVQYVAKNV